MAAQLGASDDYVTTVSKERRAEIEAEVNEKGPGGWWHKREFYKVDDRDVPDENVHESWERIFYPPGSSPEEQDRHPNAPIVKMLTEFGEPNTKQDHRKPNKVQ